MQLDKNIIRLVRIPYALPKQFRAGHFSSACSIESNGFGNEGDVRFDLLKKTLFNSLKATPFNLLKTSNVRHQPRSKVLVKP